MDSVFCYLDEILVFSRTYEEHLKHLATVFQHLANNSVTLNSAKLVFCTKTVNFLGNTITSHGFEPMQEKHDFIRSLTPLQTIEALRRVVGIFNFYRTFHLQSACRNRSSITECLAKR